MDSTVLKMHAQLSSRDGGLFISERMHQRGKAQARVMVACCGTPVPCVQEIEDGLITCCTEATVSSHPVPRETHNDRWQQKQNYRDSRYRDRKLRNKTKPTKIGQDTGGEIKEQEMKWKDSNRGQEIKKKRQIQSQERDKQQRSSCKRHNKLLFRRSCSQESGGTNRQTWKDKKKSIFCLLFLITFSACVQRMWRWRSFFIDYERHVHRLSVSVAASPVSEDWVALCYSEKNEHEQGNNNFFTASGIFLYDPYLCEVIQVIVCIFLTQQTWSHFQKSNSMNDL